MMATYEQYMNAARNADAAGDEAAARQLVQAALALKGAPKETQPETGGLLSAAGVAPLRKEGQTFGQALRENIVGEGEVDTFGEQVGDVLGTAAAGGLRGIKGILEVPEIVLRLGNRADQEIHSLAGSRDPDREKTAIFDTYTGRILERGYEGIANIAGADPEGLQRRGETTAAQYAGTVGEFLPAAFGGGSGAVKSMVAAGVGSETAGQLTEGTEFEPYARVIGAFAAPSAIAAAKKTGNKTLELATKQSVEKPSLETARSAKNRAYDAFTDAGGKVEVNMDPVISTIERAIDGSDVFIDYATGTNPYVDAARKALIKHSGNQLNLAQLDKLRAGLGRTYKQSGFDPKVAFIRDKIDEVIDAAPAVGGKDASDLLSLARASNRKYKKMEAFEEVMAKAERAADVSGNVVQKYRSATKRILDNPSLRVKFDAPEIEVMEKFLKGNVPERVLNFAGNLAPSGVGYQTFLNLGAIALDPTLLAATATATAAKVGGQAIGKKQLEQVRSTVMTGVKPESRPMVTDERLRILLGLQAD